jgi:hypothetical protein
MRCAPPSLTLESCFADSRQDYIVKLIEDAEAAQLRSQSLKQFRPDRNDQRYHPACQSHLYAGSQFRPDRNGQRNHKPDCQSYHYAGSYSALKHLLFAGRHFNLPKAWETLPHPRSTVTVQTIISPVSYKARATHAPTPQPSPRARGEGEDLERDQRTQRSACASPWATNISPLAGLGQNGQSFDFWLLRSCRCRRLRTQGSSYLHDVIR